ncbi:Protein kinase-like domain protein [Niveomyces insectorum RCEF 264]|uniref:Protein kinase-like domain protein n=1 Tax=Niveomyces insectorum RCEF 264 TaxID=1081102 RepID=A0A167MP62_9HYPO|nr:Protein kinase-like domain protein [Niveomyces insectorum RCEF 264]
MSQLRNGLSISIPLPTPLPYFCDPTQLPGVLPSADEIEHAEAILPTIRDPRQDRIVLIRGCFVVKYGTYVTENEGQAILFLAKHTFVPTPPLYAMYYRGARLFLIMGHMPGTQLSSVWDGLSGSEKDHILVQLKSIWTYLRSIPAPALFFGGVTGGPLRHRFFLWKEADPSITGPFQTEEQLGQALAHRSLKNWEGNLRRPQTPEFFARHLPKVLSGHPSVLTHGDLQRKNILVEELPPTGFPDGAVTGEREIIRRFRVSAVLDWEDAGWYPSYWEYAASFVDFQWHDDWPEKVEKMLDAYPLEAAMLKLVRQDLDY